MPFDPKEFDAFKSKSVPEKEVAEEKDGFDKAIDFALSPSGAATIGGIGAGIATGGMGLIPATLLTGAGAGAGAMFGEVAEMVRGRGPETIREGIEEVGEAAAKAAVSNLVVGGAFKAMAHAVPVMAQVISKVPRVAFLRAMERPQALKGFTFSMDDLGPDKKGMGAVVKIWDNFHKTRKALGAEVDNALVGLSKKAEGFKAYMADVADEAEGIINTASANDPAILEALKKSDPNIEFVSGIIRKMRGGSNKVLSPDGNIITSGVTADAEQLVSMRKAVDAMTDFAEGSDVASSAPSQLALRSMGAKIREKISEIAEMAGDKELLLANRRYRNVIKTGNEMSYLFPIKKDTKAAVGVAWESFHNKFLRGGWRKDLIEEISSRIPGGAEAADEAMDASVAKVFTKLPEGTPSGLGKDFVRTLLNPQISSVAIRTASIIRELGKSSVMAGQLNTEYDTSVNPGALEK